MKTATVISYLGMFLVILLYALFASVFTVSKTALEYSAPFFLVGSRMAVAGLLLLGYQYFIKKTSFRFERSHLWNMVLLAIFGIYLTNVFEFWGLKYLTSFKTCFIYSLSPFIAALLAYYFLNERMTRRKWLGFSIGIAGFIPILMAQSQAEESTGHLFFFSGAELAVVAAVVCSVYGWVLLKKVVAEDGYSPLTANGTSMFIGGF